MKVSDIKNTLGRFAVGIAGAGGLGSNCAAALARSGIGTLVISDFDIVEKQNLDRQFYFADQVGMKKVVALKENLLRINNELKIIEHNIKLTRENIPEIYADCDVIVEAFDKPEMKNMLIEVVQVHMPKIPLVVGSGLAGWGNTELLRSRKLDDSLYVCGDEISETSDDLPPLAPRVGIVAHMQANIVIEILMKKNSNPKTE
jgi:sulfur carrier protein ThiS adenylyltransferase